MKRKQMKLPNGFGQITKLKGNLRRPYRSMITVGHTDTGKPISKLLKPVAYFETYNDAYYALMDHNRNPYEINKDATLEEVYNEWFEEHSKKISASRQRSIRYSWKKLENYYNVKLSDIKPKVINLIMEEHSSDTGETRKKIKSLLNQIMDYGVMNEIIDKNYSRISMIKIDDPNQVIKGHISFTDYEISALWDHKKDLYTRWILIQCYTGMRPGELCQIKLENIYLEDNYMIGGIKTKAGKNRVIPIHKAIRELIKAQIQDSIDNESTYLLSEYDLPQIQYDVYKRRFYSVISKYQLNKEHTPHDCRKYFTSVAKRYNINEYALKRILGHQITDLTERVYTERPVDWLISEINKIQCMNAV